MLDEVSSQVAEYIRKNLSYEEIVSYFLKKEETDSDDAEKDVDKINGGKRSSDFNSICTNIRKPEIEVE